MSTPPDRTTEDRTFLTDGRPYLNARQAAIYCGYEPAPPGMPRLQDRQILTFFAWANSRGIRSVPGRRGLYRRDALDAAIAGKPIQVSEDVERGRRLAREDVAEFRRRAHLVAARRQDGK